MKSRGCAKLTIELVQTGPSLFQNEAWSTLDQLNGWCDAPSNFLLAPLDFEYLAVPQVYTFFWWRLYTGFAKAMWSIMIANHFLF